MPPKLLVVPSHADAHNVCAFCRKQATRIPGFSMTKPGGYFGLVCNCGGGRAMEEVYPELKTPGYSLEIYQALIRQLEFLNTRSPTTAVVPPAMHEATRSAMTPENFCYWLQGRAELVAGAPTEAEWAAIVAHLALVFNKVTPYQGPWPMPMQPGPAPYSPFTPIC